jgi:hypothetical protein
MAKLTVDLETSADVLGTTPDRFLAWLIPNHLDRATDGIFTL